MFERFTERARRVVVLAQEEARMLNHGYIGTEHILLGLIREGEGVAAQVLEKLGADLNRVRQQVIQLIEGYAAKGEVQPGPPIEPEDFTARVARAEEIEAVARDVAAEFGHESVEPGHHWVAALRLNLRQMEEAIEAYRAKLRWAEERLTEREEAAEGPEGQRDERRDEGSGDQRPEG